MPTGLPSDAGEGLVFTTCFTYTTTGADGLPTPIHSTVIATAANPITAASAALPTNIPSVSGLSGFPPQQPVVTSSFSFTYVGADGLPTVVASTVVASIPDASSVASGGLPTGFPSIPEGPQDGAGSDGITTCFSYTITDANGIPTVIDSTVVIAAPTADGSTGLPTGPPSIPGASPGFPGSDGITTCFTYTTTGADGIPTPVETTLVVTPAGDSSGSVSSQASFPGFPSGFPSGFPTGLPYPSGAEDGGVVTTYTYLGGDGLPTIVATTLNAPSPAQTQTALPGGYPGGQDGSDGSGITTCATYTYLGADGVPTLVESTYVIPTPLNTGDGLPPVIPGQITGFPGGYPGGSGGSDGSASTTCASFTVLGADGLPTVVEQTFTVPKDGGIPTATSLGFPSVVPHVTGLPSGLTPVPESGAITTCFTAISIGSDGLPTPVVQTVVLTPGPQATTAGLPQAPPSGPALSSALAGQPQLSDYAAGAPDNAYPGGAFTPIFSDGAVLPGSGILPPFVTSDVASGPFVTGAPGGSDFPPSYDDPLGDGAQLPGSGQAPPYDADAGAGVGAFPTEVTIWPSAAAAYGDGSQETPSPAVSSPCTTLQTTTWANLIPEQTTTYTINYPLTTLATITPEAMGGAARLVRRQDK